MWVRFKRKYNWRAPAKGVSYVTYAAGRAYSVTRQCAADAIRDGAAERYQAPRRGVDPNETIDGAGASGR